MKVATVLLLAVLLAGSQAKSLRQLVGLCVEECSQDSDCRLGHTCRFTGCGHSCQSFFSVTNCLHVAVCNVHCPNGRYRTDANGCRTCGCEADPIIVQ